MQQRLLFLVSTHIVRRPKVEQTSALTSTKYMYVRAQEVPAHTYVQLREIWTTQQTFAIWGTWYDVPSKVPPCDVITRMFCK